MTKKDFELIANLIRVCGNRGSISAHNLAIAFASRYPRFNAKRFLKACEGKDGES